MAKAESRARKRSADIEHGQETNTRVKKRLRTSFASLPIEQSTTVSLALAELISYVEVMECTDDTTTIIKLAELVKLYTERSEQLRRPIQIV